MKALRIILIAALSFVFIGAGIVWQKYTNKEYGFSILLPRYWYKEEGRYNTAVMALAPQTDTKDKFRENISVMVSYAPSDMKAETYYAISKDEVMKTIPGEEFGIQEGKIVAGLHTGRLLTFSSQAEGIIFRIITGTWVIKGRVYVVTGTSEDSEFYKYEPTFKKVLRSIRIQ
ncbi:MAG: hypothetical protein FJZ10_05070 [Candidatus Omnitrophica bacterium]|nr:hypothetical protein [Candidatus Omnitrophota bacterium]